MQRLADGEASIAAVVGVDVLLAIGVIEFPHLAWRYGIERRRCAEIELRFANREGCDSLGCGDIQVGQSLHHTVLPKIFDEVFG